MFLRPKIVFKYFPFPPASKSSLNKKNQLYSPKGFLQVFSVFRHWQSDRRKGTNDFLVAASDNCRQSTANTKEKIHCEYVVFKYFKRQHPLLCSSVDFPTLPEHLRYLHLHANRLSSCFLVLFNAIKDWICAKILPRVTSKQKQHAVVMTLVIYSMAISCNLALILHNYLCFFRSPQPESPTFRSKSFGKP